MFKRDRFDPPKGGEHFRLQGWGTKIIKNAKEKVGRNPKSVGKLASAAGVSCGAMQNVLRGDLSLSPCGKTEAQLLWQVARAKGLQWAGLFLEGFGDGTQPPVRGLMRGCSLSGPCMVIRVAGFVQ